MKGKTTKLLTLALMMGFVCSTSFGQIANGPIIDGDGSDAVWGTVAAMELLRDNGTSGVTDAADFSAMLKTLWNEDTIFCLLEVMDDTLITDLNNPWERDHYSLYFDFGNHKSTSFLVDTDATMDSVQFMLEKIWSVPGNLAMEDTALREGIDFVEDVDSGSMYTLELAIPLASIGVSVAAGDVIGFDAKVGDNDADGTLDGKVSLYQILDEGWRNPSYLGTAMLETDGSFSKVKHSPVIDGTADYPWYAASEFQLEVQNTWTGVDGILDFSGSVSIMHDLDNIFVLMKVRDDTLITDLNNPWERDHYSIYFDFANLKTDVLVTDAVAPMDSVQFMLEKIWSVAGNIGMEDTALRQGIEFVEDIDSGSMYTLEMVIPLESIGVTIAEGDIIGFDSKIGDNDADGTLDGKLSWHQSLDEGWRNPSYLGNMEILPIFVDLGGFKAAPAQIEIDGVKDGDWNHAISMPLQRENDVSGVTDANDLSGTVKALWDEENIFILIEVKDDTLITDLNNPWERDHYSVYFDFGNHKSETYLVDAIEPMDSVQFMLEKIWSVEGNLAMEDTALVWDVDFVEVIDTTVGYLLEMAIPLDLIGVDLAEGMTIGFDAKIGDNDADPAGRDGTLSWNQFLDEGWRNPSYLGEVTLQGNGTFMGSPNTAPAMDAIADVTVDVVNGPTATVEVGALDPDGDDLTVTAVSSDDAIATATVDGMTITVTGVAKGTADVVVTVDDGKYGVVSDTFMVTVLDATGIEDVNRSAKFSMYPNPSTGVLNIVGLSEIQFVRVTNVAGQTVAEIPVNAQRSVLDVSSLENGMYIVSVHFTSQATANRVFVKQ